MCNKTGPSSSDSADLRLPRICLEFQPKLDESPELQAIEFINALLDQGFHCRFRVRIIYPNQSETTINVRSEPPIPGTSVSNDPKRVQHFFTIEPGVPTGKPGAYPENSGWFAPGVRELSID